MHPSEKKTYLIAILIVIMGTLVVAGGFTAGLLFLTEPDTSLHTKDRMSVDIRSTDVIIDSNDWIISTEFSSEDESLFGDIFEDDYEETVISLDDFEHGPSRTINMRRLRTADQNLGNRWIVIDKSNFTLTLNNRNGVLRKWEIAVGSGLGDKQYRGDNRTPIGTFEISQIQNSSKWTHNFGDGKGVIAGAYGPWFIRLYTPPWSGIGIHGTHDPDSIGSRVSEGCIRMNNEDVAELKEMVRVGMSVVIKE